MDTFTQTTPTVRPTCWRNVMETNAEEGRIVATYPGAVYGYVTDSEPDLQIGEILPGFIIGSEDVATDKPTLDKYKVTHIVNVATFCKNYFPDKIKYMNVVVGDYPRCKIVPFFDSVFEFVDEAREEGCVFLHCNFGVSRSSSFAIGYLIKTEGKSFSESYDIVKAARPCIEPNRGFIRQLKAYAEQLQQD